MANKFLLHTTLFNKASSNKIEKEKIMRIGSKKQVKADSPQNDRMPSLATCVLFDVIGYASYAIPFFGEFLDLLWAPLSAFIFWKMFGFKKGFFGGVFSFVEELLPGLDFIPTFTIHWLLLYFKKNKAAFSRPAFRL